MARLIKGALRGVFDFPGLVVINPTVGAPSHGGPDETPDDEAGENKRKAHQFQPGRLEELIDHRRQQSAQQPADQRIPPFERHVL